MPTRPDMRGNLNPPTLDLFWLFRFRVLCTGHDFLIDETVLDPHYERHMATFFLKARPQTDSFATRGCRGRRAWLGMRGRAGGGALASRGGGRASHDGEGLHRTSLYPYN